MSSKGFKELTISHDLSPLMAAHKAWCSGENNRKQRKRSRDYTYGKQWNDMITTTEGETMREYEYIWSQGKTPLKNNMIRQLVKSVVGHFRSQQTEPQCLARERGKRHLGEVMSTVVQYVHDSNRLGELDSRSMEEFLISGACYHKVSYGVRNGVADVWVDEINPARMFHNAIEDPRNIDCTLIGEIHDYSIADVITRWSGGSRYRASELRNIYSKATESAVRDSYTTEDSAPLECIDFFVPASPTKCRVIEVWQYESEERWRCHDYATGEYYSVALEAKESIDAENKRREKEARNTGSAPALIDAEWYIDRMWRYHFYTPMGHLLAEGVSPYWHGEHPYIVKLYPLIDGEVHSLVEDVIDQQRYINRLITMIDFVLGSSAKGVLLYPNDLLPEGLSIEDVAKLWSRPNAIIPYDARGNKNMPQQVMSSATGTGAYEMLSMQLKLMEDISGVHGALQGKEANAGTAASLYESQVQNAGTALLDIFETFKTFREDRDRKIMRTVQQYYSADKYFDITGCIHSDTILDFDPEEVRNAMFDLTITESRSLPETRKAQNEFVLELLRNGNIDVRTALQNGTFPGAENLINSIDNANINTTFMQKKQH